MQELKMKYAILAATLVGTLLLAGTPARAQSLKSSAFKKPVREPVGPVITNFDANHVAVSVIPIATGTVENPNIVPLTVEIPGNATIEDVSPEAKNWTDPDSGYARCPEEGECPIGWSKWIGTYQVTNDNCSRRIVTWSFDNWAHSMGRWARLTVVYSTPTKGTVRTQP